jgi:hypothetical protein
MISIDPTAKKEVDDAVAIAALDAWFAEQLKQGITTSGGIRLAMTESDVTLLTGNFVLAKEAAALGGQLPPLIDSDGGVHTFTAIEELTAVMLGYGLARAELSKEYARRKAEILSAVP